jgi:hypothetical protein
MKHGVFTTLLIQATVTATAPYAFLQTFAFGGTSDRRCHFKHVSLKTAGCTTVKRARLTDKGSRSTAVLPQ